MDIKHRKIFAILAMAFAAASCFAQNLANGAPVSGIVLERDSTTYFDGINTRSEWRRNGVTIIINVNGARCWMGSPVSGRLFPAPPTPPSKLSFPEETVRLFAYLTRTNAVKLGDKIMSGLPCWEYSIKRRLAGATSTQETEEITTTNYFLANLVFPLRVSDGMELKLNCPISGEMFNCPTNLKPSREFSARAPFEIETCQTRCSYRYGWSMIASNTMSTDGIQARSRHFQTTTENTGRISTFGPKFATNDVNQGFREIYSQFRAPYWPSVRKIGDASILGMKAEVYESTVLQPDEHERYWVVDHPVFGTFSARRTIVKAAEGETNEIVKLNLPAERQRQ